MPKLINSTRKVLYQIYAIIKYFYLIIEIIYFNV